MTELNVFKKRPEVTFLCAGCKKPGLTTLATDANIEEKCREYCERLEKRFNDMAALLDTKADKTELSETKKEWDEKLDSKASVTEIDDQKDRIEKIEEKISKLSDETDRISKLEEELKSLKVQLSGSDSKNVEKIVEDRMEDFQEIINRKENIIIYGVPESDDTEIENRKAADLEKVMDFLESQINVNPTVLSCIRLGKVDKGEKKTEEKKIRPLRIKVISMAQKNQIMKNYWNRKKEPGSETKYNVANDFTYFERTKHKKLVAELKKELKRMVKSV